MSKFEIKESKDVQFYFVLKAPNGEVVAVSERYTTKQSCQHGIDAVKQYAGEARVDDLTL
ncbi:hypothetical protein ATL39_2971 [Sinobaca qinghaiensis]|uniref:DUF1508 domain-containing protein n=1 Tax=Sinobaca qinghaiensis TaxID=342944 RepID=A0A419UWP8_9BACL|nr:DUF1508 domain-containing protein [Sinobaca qinghaiensis]RKD69551.1 hypothetical protein ATL39_2971 [Sinobaca qinghaiensis]